MQSIVSFEAGQDYLIALPNDAFWLIKKGAIVRHAPVPGATDAATLKGVQIVLEGPSWETTMPVPIAANPNYLLTSTAQNIQITTFQNGQLKMAQVPWAGSEPPLGGGAIQDSLGFWFATKSKIHVLDASVLQEGQIRYFWRQSDLILKGFEGTIKSIGLFLKKADSLFAEGGAVALTGTEILTAETPLGDTRAVSWSGDIMPFAHQWCVRCHWSGAPSSWRGAEIADSWMQTDRARIQKIIESETHNIQDEFKMNSITSEQRQLVKTWMKNPQEGQTPATGSPNTVAPDFETEVKPILGSRCVACHSTYSDATVINPLKTKLMTRVQGATMPPPWSQQGKDINAAERDILLRYFLSL